MPDLINLRGVPEWKRAGNQLVSRADAAARRYVGRAGTVEAQAVRRKLREGGRHERGTPTPASPGGPPAQITGKLAKAPIARRPKRVGTLTWEGGCRIRRDGFYGTMLDSGQYGPGGGRSAFPFFAEGALEVRPELGALWERTMREAF